MLEISTAKVARVIALTRENGPDDVHLHDYIGSLNADEKANLVALMWVGRESFQPEQFERAKRQAYEEAMVPCKAAVRYSKVDFGGMMSRARERKALQSRKALALSNLGVLQALVGQQETARESFEKARARNCPNSGIASYNMSVLDRRDETTGTGSVALVGSTY